MGHSVGHGPCPRSKFVMWGDAHGSAQTISTISGIAPTLAPESMHKQFPNVILRGERR